MTEIVTERLILRPVTLGDAPFIQEHFAQDDILLFMRPPVPYPYPADGAETFLRNVALPTMAKGEGMTFLILLKPTPEPIGSVGVKLDEAETHTWTRGFWMARAHRNKGYMQEASLACLRWLFAHTDAASVVIGNAPDNDASARVKEKHGFIRTGLVPANPPYHNGATESMEWEMSRQRFFELYGE